MYYFLIVIKIQNLAILKDIDYNLLNLSINANDNDIYIIISDLKYFLRLKFFKPTVNNKFYNNILITTININVDDNNYNIFFLYISKYLKMVNNIEYLIIKNFNHKYLKDIFNKLKTIAGFYKFIIINISNSENQLTNTDIYLENLTKFQTINYYKKIKDINENDNYYNIKNNEITYNIIFHKSNYLDDNILKMVNN